MKTRTVTTLEIDGAEVELEHNPEYFEPTTLKPTPDTLVVGYLIHDDDCGNPMTENDCEGTLYTFNEGVISDDKYAAHKLGLLSFPGLGRWRGSDFAMDYNLELDGISERVAEIVRAKIKADPEMVTWMTACVLEKDVPMEELVENIVGVLEWVGYSSLDWSTEEDQDMISRLGDYETLATIAWEDMYAAGLIGEYLAVPVRYVDNNHGPGTTTIDTASLDDCDDCNAVWVPDAGAIENMSFNGCETYADKLKVAEKYAESVLKNYQTWCNGDCWGHVVESFRLEDGKYVRLDEDSCWGFIGQEYAEEALSDRMQEVADEMKEEVK